MSLLPSMLLTTALIGAGGNVQADLSSLDMNALQNLAKDCAVNGQIIAGSPSEIKDILDGMGIRLDGITDCVRPGVPDFDGSGSGNNRPGTEAPDQGGDRPGAGKPDSGTETPDAPSQKPEENLPGNEQDVNQSYVEQVVALVNAERAKVNLPALNMSQEINAAAQIRAKETVQSFSHTRPNGSTFSTVLRENGIAFRGAGENIAYGQRTPEEVVRGWMNSEGHRANILNKNYTSIGVGYYLNGNTPYWVQLFTY